MTINSIFLLRLSRFEVVSARFAKMVIPVLKQFLMGDKSQGLKPKKAKHTTEKGIIAAKLAAGCEDMNRNYKKKKNPLGLSRFEVASAGLSKTVIPVLKQFLTGDTSPGPNQTN